MYIKVIKEVRPDDREHILTCEITYWWSGLTGRKDRAQFLMYQAEGEKIKYFECPDMTPITDSDTGDAIYAAFLVYVAEQEAQKAAGVLRKKYEDYFEEPITGPQNYRGSNETQDNN